MERWIEPRTCGTFKFPQERVAVAAIFQVIADPARLLQVEDDEVVPGALRTERPRRRRAGFLMGGFAMDDRSHLLGGILPDAFPYAHHVAARRVHHLATAIPDQLDGDDFGSKSGDDHHVAGFEPGDFLRAWPSREPLDP